MRLFEAKLEKALRVLDEAISREDFFDFYVLQQAAHDPATAGDREIQRRHEYETDWVYTDHMKQFGQILLSRFADKHVEGRRELYAAYGLDVDDPSIMRGLNIDTGNMTIGRMAVLVSEVLKSGVLASRFATDTWQMLGEKFVELSTARTTRERVVAIDAIHGLMHHGGSLTDYFQESWLDDALNYRTVATLPQLLKRASSDVRALVGSGGRTTTTPSPVAIMEIALERAARYEKCAVKIQNNGDRLTISVPLAVAVGDGTPLAKRIVSKTDGVYYVYTPGRVLSNLYRRGEELRSIHGYERYKIVWVEATVRYGRGQYVVEVGDQQYAVPNSWRRGGTKTDQSDSGQTIMFNQFELAKKILSLIGSLPATRELGKLSILSQFGEKDVTPNMRRYTEAERNIKDRDLWRDNGYEVSRDGTLKWVGKP